MFINLDCCCVNVAQISSISHSEDPNYPKLFIKYIDGTKDTITYDTMEQMLKIYNETVTTLCSLGGELTLC